MKITLQDYLINPSDFSEEQLRQGEDFSVEAEEFTLKCFRENMIKDLKKFFTLRGYKFVDGKTKQGFHIGAFRIMKEEEIVAIAAIAALPRVNLTSISVSLWK